MNRSVFSTKCESKPKGNGGLDPNKRKSRKEGGVEAFEGRIGGGLIRRGPPFEGGVGKRTIE